MNRHFQIQRLPMAGPSPDSSARWTRIAARSVGTSHVKAGKGCDDFGACLETTGRNGPVLIAVASDGAGSAIHSAKGSRITTRAFVRSSFNYLATGQDLTDLSLDVVGDWIDDIRGRINAAALRVSVPRREFAATLVGCLIGTDSSIFIHIGDGAAVYRARGETDWTVPTWPGTR
jgi:Protein phosphatase 2C